ncbi:MAG TPA: hypothetical protein VIV06_12545, partial [Candidatus Limnocylindrales bacterium]
VGPHIAFDCGRGDPSSFATREGALDGSARVEVTAGCGALSVTTAPGSAWQLVAGSTAGRSPRVTASATSLSIDAGDRGGWHGFGGGRDVWRLTLPTTSIDDLSLVLNAGEGTVDLPGAQLGRLSVTSNAAQTSLNLSQASIAGLAGTVNAGWLSFELPSAGDIDGSFVVNAGALNICAPDGLGVRVQRTGIANSVKYRGLEQGGGEWQSPDYASAAHRADLTVSANFGSVDINPTGGCK